MDKNLAIQQINEILERLGDLEEAVLADETQHDDVRVIEYLLWVGGK